MKSLLLLTCLLGLILSARLFFWSQNQSKPIPGNTITLKTTLLNEPAVRFNNQVFHTNGLTVFAPKYPQLYYGDSLKIEGIVEQEELFSKTNGKMIKQLVIKKPKISISKNKGLAIPSFVRQRIQATFNAYLPHQEAALLLGIIFGFRNDIPKVYYDQLRVTGVLHVVAASGANVSILAGFLLGSFQLFVKRRLALLFTILGILFYALLTGFDPPITRAALMAIIAFAAAGLGRQNASLLALLLTGFAMIFFTPSLFTNIGFQLSFLSTFGIVAIKPTLDSAIIGRRRSILLEDLTTTLSAQIATLPILITSFGSYSPISIIVNFCILWTVPFLMILGGIAAIAALILPLLSVPFLYLSYPFLLFFKMVVNFFSRPAEILSIPQLNVFMLGGIYCLITALFFGLKKKGKKHED